jgi:cytochrome P450
MATDTTSRNVFDAGLPTLTYHVTDTPQQIYPRFRAAQAEEPIALGPLGPEVLSYDLARAVLRDPHFVIPQGIHLSAHGITSGPLWERVTRSILNMEGEEHRRLRSLVSRAFTPRATARMHDTIHSVVNGLVDKVRDAGRCEFVADIARPYPIPIICALLGAPPRDWQLFSRWAEDIFKIVSFDCDLAAEEPVVLKAWDEFDGYLDEMIAERRQHLTDDLLSDFIRTEDSGDRLDAGEMRMLAFSIRIAGTDTTRSQLAASMQVLCDHPEQWALLRARPELAMRTVEETMRHSPSMCSTVRSVIEDVTIDEYTFPANTFIIVNTYASNRDDTVYDEPERFDITRDAPPPILTFGGGVHYRLGANLARLELAEAWPSCPAGSPIHVSPARPPGNRCWG